LTKKRLSSSIVVGLDLAGSPTRRTGFCALDEDLVCRTTVLHSDDEIVDAVMGAAPGVVSIDAPLFLPKGRRSLEDRGPPHFRQCDKELMRMKIKFFPISLGPMRKLTARGMTLRSHFEARDLKVIESFPGAIQDVLGMPRKQRGLEKLRKALLDYGITGDLNKEGITDDELDAVTSAIVGRLYFEGNYLAIGDPDEGLMILPRSTKSRANV
jgi:predicted nuclease with RNAse H fold